jgi:hypothetical protein
MAAPKGNEFWKQRYKHGRDKIFENPELLDEAANEYFQWCFENPLIEKDFVGKDATEVEKPKMRAFTWSGLELFVGIYSLRDYRNNPEYKGFSQILSRIERIIFTQKFEGAAAGLLNQNIIARDLKLYDSDPAQPTNLTVTISGPTPPTE